MRVKKVPLQDLELWPDEVICFSAYTDTRNPVQQRRTYVDGEKLKAENAKLRKIAADIHKALFALEIDLCQACPRNTVNGPCTKFRVFGSSECSIEKDMRELGMERDA